MSNNLKTCFNSKNGSIKSSMKPDGKAAIIMFQFQKWFD